jgi:N-acetylglucosaminyldiphosphoundecaprenol N-acetyl-beta-D-mannosaminyltransferase
MGAAPDRQTERIRIGGLPIDCLSFERAMDAIEALVAAGRGGSVFTPNVDHVVQFAENPLLRAAYETASLSLADGMPLVWASRLAGVPLPEKVSGSDLTLPLLQRAASRAWRVFFLGGAEGVADTAKARVREMLPELNVVGTLSPRVDIGEPPERRAWVLDAVRATSPHIVLVALGAPKQELFIAESQSALRPAVLLGIGASLDFLAGVMPRAPGWMSRFGLEWAFRLAREPRRLWRRYLLRDPKFALILLRSVGRRLSREGQVPSAGP